MSAHVWNGTAFKKIKQRAYWTGSAWKIIKSSYRWTGSAWELIYSSFAAVGMTKNGDQTLPSTTWTEIGPFTPEVGATVVGNALRISGAGPATIHVGSEWPTSATSRNYRVTRNGTEIVWTKGNTTGSTTFADTFALTVADGDLLRCEGYVNSGVVGNRVVKDGANTYLRMVPAT
ncbi:hypothetical protein XU06_23025 [Rhodococcus erythropolis]|uniref:hypothetical protein n=1 Tax=Rhodococcus erythropolis TaxID=1833 RepID=UPI00061B64FA|nr:hypothetical protein [Rhodococcus erythropolis]AKD99224.1 hypothetical protein XU06_23025 [Rhodococcus erythropolis]